MQFQKFITDLREQINKSVLNLYRTKGQEQPKYFKEMTFF